MKRKPPGRQKAEANNGLKNTRGTLAMARTRKAPHSATAQFFINVANRRLLPTSPASLRGWGYCVFAEVVEGMDVVDKIKARRPLAVAVCTGRTKEDVIIENVTVSGNRGDTVCADLHLQTEEPAIVAGFLHF